jgi:small multidrug resistance pump
LPTLLFLSLISFSVAGFNVALSQIDVSVAYALWSALGTVIVSTAGVLFFNESCDAIKLTCIALIIVGVVGLNVRETHG